MFLVIIWSKLLFFKKGFAPTLTETKPDIKTKAVHIIDFDLVITVSPAGYANYLYQCSHYV